MAYQIVDELIDWMIAGAPPHAEIAPMLAEVCTRLRAIGIPVDRCALFIYALHPNLIGWRVGWTPEGGADMAEGKLGLFSTAEYTANPLPEVVRSRIPVRRRLHDPATPHDYIIVKELIDDGFSDYFVQPLVYTAGEANAVSWSSKAPGGFSDEAIAVLERVNQPLARLAEAHLLRINASTILSAYLGRNSGDQVLGGKVHRGDGEEIEAVILFTDLVDFTEMSDVLDGPQMVHILNEVFDVIVPPVAVHGGEILKFMGDGFFAIFPYRGEAELKRAVAAASRAVTEAEQALAAASLGEMVRFRSALHAGPFHYGNIGGGSRLDFTAIGRPVNYAARLLAAAGSLGLLRVASEFVAPHLATPAWLAETAEFKGFSGKQALFTY